MSQSVTRSMAVRGPGKSAACRGLLLAVAVLAASVQPGVGQRARDPQRADYSSFRIVTERNIFNPRRYATSNSSRQNRPASRVDSFTLVGTMSYEKGPFAFFESTSSAYRKVAKIADEIAGYKITNIQQNSVKLASGTNEIQLAVGMQMRREEDGPWRPGSSPEAGGDRPAEVAAATTPSARENPVTSQTTETVTPAATPPATGSSTEDEVLKRLMQRREQELNR